MKRLLFALALATVLPALLAAPALACARTFCVHPSGGDDTAAIQAAFNAAVKAGPGSTVRFSAGHFYTNNILVRNFRGYFRGAGEHRTVIDCLRGLDPNLPGVTAVAPVTGPGAVAWPFLVGFVGGNVSVSDLSFHTTAASPAVPTDITSDVLQAIVLVMGNANASSDFYRVAITAGPGDDHGYDADEDLIIMGYAPTDQDGNPTAFGAIHGSESVRDCSFTGHDGIQVQGLTAGRLAITGSVFDDWAVGCLLDDSAGASRIVVCDNRMQADAWGCVALDQGWQAAGGAGAPLPPLPAPHCLIADNVMLAGPDLSDGSIVSGANGVFVEDDSPLYGAPDRLDAVIAHNRITLDNCGFDGGIDGIYARGIKVLGNRISGVGLSGILLGFVSSLWGMQSEPCSGWKIVGNDVSGVTATGEQYGGAPTAQVWLGPDADHCLVVGGCKPTTVLDQGTDDTLVNVTATDPPVALAAPTDPLTQVMQLKGMMRP